MSSEQAGILAAGIESPSKELATMPVRWFSAPTGRVALRCLRMHPDMDAVISTWDLPDMPDGRLPALIRCTWPSRPVIVLVPDDHPEKELAARLIGPVGVLHRTCDPALLAQYVRQVLRNRVAMAPGRHVAAAVC